MRWRTSFVLFLNGCCKSLELNSRQQATPKLVQARVQQKKSGFWAADDILALGWVMERYADTGRYLPKGWSRGYYLTLHVLILLGDENLMDLHYANR